ncbi:MAG: two-component regulator propeller domain-containing protein [Bacteroidota bacterium]
MYKLYFFLLNLLIIHGLHSQDTNPFDKINRKQALYFTHLKRENGLPSNEVNCFIQDLQGYIWIGTSNGLVRFDGHDMKIFRSVPGDSSSLADNTVYSLLQSRDSLIWIGTSGGISVFKPGTGHIRNLPFVPPSGIPMVSSYIIRSLYEDHAGVLWAGTDHGLIRVSDNRKRIVQVPLWKPGNIRDRENIFDNVYSLLDDPRDETRLLVATGGGLVQFDKQSRLITNEYRKYISKNFLAPNDLFYDGLDGLWVCGWGMGLNRFDLKTETWQEFPVNKTTPVSILSISKKSRDELWLATTDNGLGLFNRRTGSFTFYRHDPSDPNSLLSNTVQEVCYFNNGEDLWIAGPDGISRQNRAYLSFQQISIPFKFSWINAFYRDVSKGKLYAGGYDCQGLFAWDEHLQRWDLIPGEQPAASNGLSVTHLFQDHSGVLWVATRQNLKYLDYGQNRLHLFRLADGKPLDLKDPVVYGLTEDKKGNLWVGTRYDGVFRIDPGRKQATRFRHIPGDQQSLAEGTHHIAIKEDKYNRIWIGNRNGISIYDPEQNCFLNFMMDTLRHYGIRKRWINSMEKDTLGRMWLGINGEGLVRLEEPQKGTFRFKLFHTGNGLNDQAIGWMTSDMEGNFWIVNQGLLRMNPYRETFQLIDTRNGLHENPGWAL